MKPKQIVKIDENGTNKKVYFGDGGVVVDKPVIKQKIKKVPEKVEEQVEEEIAENPPTKFKKNFKKQQQNGEDLETKWYQFYAEYNTSEFKEIKDSELSTLHSLCRNAFNDEIQKLSKSNYIHTITLFQKMTLKTFTFR